MVKKNKFQQVGIRTALSAAMLLTATSANSASIVSVDGDLTDLIGAINVYPSAIYNSATALDPLGSADSPVSESNNGFDIKNVYAYYNSSLDTLYLGMSVYGTVGDSQALGALNPYERPTGCGVGFPTPTSSCFRNIFDTNETYRFSITNADNNEDLLAYVITGHNGLTDTGTDTGNATVDPYSLSVNFAVSESSNGVELSVTGLGNILFPNLFNPADLSIFFGAGSSDIYGASTGGEDTHTLSMQAVPVPAAAWLFGSGLLGLVGFSRRQRGKQSA